MSNGKRSTPLLVLGLGNDILCDDGVGLHVVRQLRERLAELPAVSIVDTCEMGLSLLDYFDGFTHAILVDAVQTRQVPPGHIHKINLTDLPALSQFSPHFLGVGETLAVGKLLGLTMPTTLKIYAIEVADPFTVTTEMTATMTRALPAIVEHLESAIRQEVHELRMAL